MQASLAVMDALISGGETYCIMSCVIYKKSDRRGMVQGEYIVYKAPNRRAGALQLR